MDDMENEFRRDCVKCPLDKSHIIRIVLNDEQTPRLAVRDVEVIDTRRPSTFLRFIVVITTSFYVSLEEESVFRERSPEDVAHSASQPRRDGLLGDPECVAEIARCHLLGRLVVAAIIGQRQYLLLAIRECMLRIRFEGA